jgi:hypothetical protein
MKAKKNSLRGIILFSLIFSLTLCVNNAFGAIIRVPDDQPTIQEAIDVANYLDTVLVTPGTYNGTNNVNIDFKMKAITVECDGPPGSCVIDCENTNSTRGFVFQSGEGNDSILSGFTIRNGEQQNGGGIYILNSSPVINNCNIEYNNAYDGGGIYCGNSSPIISNCIIRWNTASRYGGGVYSYYGSDPILNNCVISYNTADYGAGICSYGFGTDPEVINCTFSMNSAGASGGGGIACLNNSSPTVINSILWNDSPDEIYSGTPTVSYCNVQGGYPGEGNIDQDPLFVDMLNGDFHITSNSPCIDNGTNDAPLSSTDFEGDPRKCDGDGNGSEIVDMGSDEYCDEAPPKIVIKANGKNGPVIVSPSDNVNITVSLDPGSMRDVNCDWWVAGLTTFGTYWLNPSLNWVKSGNPISVVQAPLSDLSTTSLLNTPLLMGVYTFFFIVDNSPDGNFDLTSGGFWGDYLNLFSIADGIQDDAVIDLDDILKGPSDISLGN